MHGCKKRRSDRQDTVGRIGRRAGYADRQSSPGVDQRIVRETNAAHARDRAEPFAQIAVERGDLRVVVAGLPGIQLEQQHILAIEAEFDRLQIRKCSHEEPSRNQHQQ